MTSDATFVKVVIVMADSRCSSISIIKPDPVSNNCTLVVADHVQLVVTGANTVLGILIAGCKEDLLN